jgi:hypothetical protein
MARGAAQGQLCGPAPRVPARCAPFWRRPERPVAQHRETPGEHPGGEYGGQLSHNAAQAAVVARNSMYPQGCGGMAGGTFWVSLLELRQFQVLSRAIRLRPRADPHLQVPPWLRSTISCSRHVPAGTIGPAGSIRYSPAWIWVVLERPDHSRHDARVFRAPTATTFFLAPVVAALPSPHGAAGAGAAT